MSEFQPSGNLGVDVHRLAAVVAGAQSVEQEWQKAHGERLLAELVKGNPAVAAVVPQPVAYPSFVTGARSALGADLQLLASTDVALPDGVPGDLAVLVAELRELHRGLA